MRTPIFLYLLFIPSLLLAQQMNWGSGMAMGMQGCGYPQAAGRQAQNDSDEISEMKNQIKDLEKDKAERSKELAQAKKELQKSETGLKTAFDREVYEFLKSHFDSRSRCRDYPGFAGSEESSPVSLKNEDEPNDKSAQSGSGKGRRDSDGSRGERGGPPRARAFAKIVTDDVSRAESIEPAHLAKVWANVCDFENNPRGKIRASICENKDFIEGSDVNACKQAVVTYPRFRADVIRLQKELETLTETIKDTRAMMAEARKQPRDRDDLETTEGGICIACLTGGGAQRANGGNSGAITGLASNALAAFLAYSSTKSFYGDMADKYANLGFTPPMPASSPFMAASPYILGALNIGLGQGSFGCAGQSGMSTMMGGGVSAGGVMNPQMMMSGGMNSMMGLGQQNSGVFGLPQWAQSSPLAAMTMMGGLSTGSMGSMYGSSGMYNPLMLQSGMTSSGLTGLSGIYGLSGLSGLSGLGGLSGLSGLNGLSGISSLNGGMNTQLMQFQIQQQQLSAQQQMQYYQNALQKTQAMSGLQTELAGLLQRIQTVQSGSYYNSGTLNTLSGGYGGLPTTYTGTVLNSR